MGRESYETKEDDLEVAHCGDVIHLCPTPLFTPKPELEVDEYNNSFDKWYFDTYSSPHVSYPPSSDDNNDSLSSISSNDGYYDSDPESYSALLRQVREETESLVAAEARL
jgi:hypothetical protein